MQNRYTDNQLVTKTKSVHKTNTMRKYKYSQITKPMPDGLHTKTKLYTIFLGPGCRHQFRSLRAAQNFAARYSREINRSLHTFNILLVELYSANRAAWFYFFDQASGKNSLDTEKRVSDYIVSCERGLFRAAHNCTGAHISSNIWHVLCQCSNDLQAGFIDLAAFLYARRLYAESEKLKIYACQAENEKTRLAGLFGFEME